jgi:ssDNA thymidine ADP-ribosyltransferase, DarT
MTALLTREKALIFRITHRDNIPWLMANGAHGKNAHVSDPKFVSIGNPELIDKRHHRPVTCSPFGTLSDYVPFYFTPHSPMLYNIKTGYGGIRKRSNEEIVILVSSLSVLKARDVSFVFTDRHAYLSAAQFFSDPSMLYPAHAIIRNSVGVMTRKLSVTSSQ